MAHASATGPDPPDNAPVNVSDDAAVEAGGTCTSRSNGVAGAGCGVAVGVPGVDGVLGVEGAVGLAGVVGTTSELSRDA